MSAPKVSLKKGKEKPLARKHPWIFSGAIARQEESIEPGEWVEVTDYEGNTLGFGHYGRASIAVRMLRFGKTATRESVYRDALKSAINLRKSIGFPNSSTNSFRLVHGESDGIPGLIIDWYDGHVVMQGHTAGILSDHELIAEQLNELCGAEIRSLLFKSTLSHGNEKTTKELKGPVPEQVEILENGHPFLVSVKTGQKTGFFLDQRDNRQLLGSISKGKRILNAFSYTGGFSVYALKAGAEQVISIDSSSNALELGERNMALNECASRHQSVEADVMQYLKEQDLGEFNVVILDPPAFAKSRKNRHKAVQAYKRLNAGAMESMSPGSLLMTFSCSQVVDKQLFQDTLSAAAIESGRNVRVLYQLHQPADHPVSLAHPESEYLKGLLLSVD